MDFSVWLNVNEIERSWFREGIIVRFSRRECGQGVFQDLGFVEVRACMVMFRF